jgi:hypothetical protein
VKVGDLVRHFLTEQIGIVIDMSEVHSGTRVLWTTQGLSMFGPGHKEWTMQESLEVLNESR